MKIHSLRLAALAALPLLGACADAASDAPGQKVKVQVAPLTLPTIDDVCYGLTVYNGNPAATPAPDTVWSQQQICSTQYGNAGGGDITYIGTCDANGQDNYVELVLEDVYAGGSPSPLLDQVTAAGGDADFENPCTANEPCTLHFACQENADVEVRFDLTIMRDANQGFFDVAVNFEDIFCSAKFDSCYDVQTTQVPLTVSLQGTTLYVFHGSDGVTYYIGGGSPGAMNVYVATDLGGYRQIGLAGMAAPVPSTYNLNGVELTLATTSVATGGTPMNLLFGPDGREHTAVAAVACTAGADSNGTEIVFSKPVVTCDQVSFGLDLAGLDGGNHTVSASAGDVTYTLPFAVYFGNELLDCGSDAGSCEKVYYNVALDIAALDAQGLTNCAYAAGVTAVETGSKVIDASGTFTDPNGVYPGISFGVPEGIAVVGEDGTLCTANPLNGDNSLVKTGYMKGTAFGEGRMFKADFHTSGGIATAYGSAVSE